MTMALLAFQVSGAKNELDRSTTRQTVTLKLTDRQTDRQTDRDTHNFLHTLLEFFQYYILVHRFIYKNIPHTTYSWTLLLCKVA